MSQAGKFYLKVEDGDIRKEETATKNDDYDPHEHREVPHGLSSKISLVHILKGAIGTGILAMPQAMKNSGYIFGVIMVFPISWLITACVHMLMYSRYRICKKRRVSNMTYSESVRHCLLEGPSCCRSFSEMGGHLSDIIFSIAQTGACAAYVMFIAESLKKILAQSVNWNVKIFMLILVLPLSLLNMIRDLKYLAPFSMMANTFVISGIGVILYYIFKDGLSFADRTTFSSPSTWPLYFGTVFFAFQTLGVVIPVEYKMKHPKDFSRLCGVMNIAMSFITILYTFFGVVGYLKYGEAVQGSITLNLPENEVLATVISVLYVLSISLSHPLLANFPIEVLLSYTKCFIAEDSLKFKTAEIIVRLVFVWITVLLAIAVPNLGLVISICGSFSTCLTGFIIPAIMEFCLNYGESGMKCNWYLFREIFVIITGFTCLILGLYVAFL